MRNTLLVFSFFMFISCSIMQDEDREVIRFNPTTNVTIQSDSLVRYYDKLSEKTFVSKEMQIEIVDDNITYNLEVNGKIDTTLSIEATSPNLILRFSINFYDFYDFEFPSGDSLKLDIKNGKMRILSNLSECKIERNLDQQFSYLAMFENAEFFFVKNNFSKISNAAQPKSKIEIFHRNENGARELKERIADSLKNEFEQKALQLKQNIDCSYSSDFSNYKYHNELLCYQTRTHAIDSLSYRSKYIEVLKRTKSNHLRYKPTEAFFDTYYLSQAPITPFGMGLKRDYKQTISKVVSSFVLSSNEKEYLIKKILESVASDTPDKFKSYYESKKALISNYISSSDIEKRYTTLLNPSSDASELIIQSSNGEVSTLHHILMNTSKPVYVDFWASWCAPCIKEIPTSLNLKEAYKKDIEFIFLSMDDDMVKWSNSMKKLGMADSSNNYVLLNKTISSFIKDNDIASIPRYILFDKKGKIKYSNAPRPSDPELKKLFEELLEQ